MPRAAVCLLPWEMSRLERGMDDVLAPNGDLLLELLRRMGLERGTALLCD